MRKKYLEKQYTALCEDVQNYRFEIVRLNKLIKDKDAQIEELNTKISNNAENTVSEVAAVDEENGEPVIPVESSYFKEENTELPVIEEITLDDITEYGATVIGELVVVSAEYGNRLSENGNSDNRELLNLILGRTEVAKSEVLGIVSSQCCAEEKKSLMDDVKVKAFEYFDSVMAQI